MKPPTKIEARICLFADGKRLDEQTPLPIRVVEFPLDEQGIMDAQTARRDLQEYCDSQRGAV